MKKTAAMKIALIAVAVIPAILAGAFITLSPRAAEYRRASAEYRELSLLGPAEGSDAGAANGETYWMSAEVDFDALRAINPEVAAWIVIPGTHIDYPVAAGRDNAHYLTHTFSDMQNRSGAIFVDYRCARDFSGKNTLIHGHHMKDGSMFRDLLRYQDETFARAHADIWLYTREKTFRLRVFSVGTVSVFTPFWRQDFTDDLGFLEFVGAAADRSETDFDVLPSAKDRVLTLVTCDNLTDDARYVVHALMTEANGWKVRPG